MNHLAAASVQLNQYRRIGEIGPVYQVKPYGRIDEEGERWIRILLIESGEETEYKALHAADDPIAA